MSIQLSITNQTRAAVDRPWLEKQLGAVLQLLGIGRGEWSITVVSDRAMAALHQRTMNIAGTTDVLTFDLAERRGAGKALELDTVVCRDEAVRRARELGHAVREELLLYAIHSLLHVRGYDDVTAAKAARMHRREDAILLRLGVGRIYAGAGKDKVSGPPRARKAVS